METEKHGKLTGSVKVDTSEIPSFIKVSLLVKELVNGWVKAGKPLSFKVVPI